MYFFFSLSIKLENIVLTDFDEINYLKFLLPTSLDIEKVFPELCLTLKHYLIFYFWKILEFVLIYEVIKSFRKYSRKF